MKSLLLSAAAFGTLLTIALPVAADGPSAAAELFASAQKHAQNLATTAYKHERDASGAIVTTTSQSKYDIEADCSGWVSYNLQQIADKAPYQAALDFKKSDSQENGDAYVRAYIYRKYFADLPTGAPFERIYKLADIKPGDILAWCLNGWCKVPYQSEPSGDTGHVMIIAGTPIQQDDSHAFVMVLDSSSVTHYSFSTMLAALPAAAQANAQAQKAAYDSYPDIRDNNGGKHGVGAGFILFGTNPDGTIANFQFGPGDSVNPKPGQTALFAVGRPK